MPFSVDPFLSLAGLVVGFVIGLTGMGGGALMTPVLVLLFGVQPLAAVSSDLVVSVLLKPVGALVHWRRGTINLSLVFWLALGSVPSAFAGVFLLRMVGAGDQARLQQVLRIALGVALLLASLPLVFKGVIARRNLAATAPAPLLSMPPAASLAINRPVTLLIGVAGGLIVGVTSVGSGSLMIVALLLLYPRLKLRELVGTDLAQAIPLVASAAAAHLMFGDVKFDLTASLLVGALPGVYFGARLSSRTPDRVIRPALALVLVASALKLLGASTPAVSWTSLGLVALLGASFFAKRLRWQSAPPAVGAPDPTVRA